MPQTHIIEVGTTEDMDTKYLVDVLMWGLEQHNEAVRKGLPWTLQPDTDHYVNPTHMTILSDDHPVYIVAAGDITDILGRPATEEELARVGDAIPHSSIPEALMTIVDSIED